MLFELEDMVKAPATLSLVAFSGIVSSTESAASARSTPSLNALLGGYDQLAFQVVTQRVKAGAAPVGLAAWIEHSADGRHWISKRDALDLPGLDILDTLPPSEPEVVTEALSLAGPTFPNLGFDDGSTPTLGLVRLKIYLKAHKAPVSAFVQVHVTANNFQEQRFSQYVATMSAADGMGHYAYCYPGGVAFPGMLVIEMYPFLKQKKYLADVKYDGVPSATTEYQKHLHADPMSYYPQDVLITLKQGLMVCFKHDGEYVLVKGGVVIWDSLTYKKDAAKSPFYADLPGGASTKQAPKPFTGA